jgi:hypothetical protein
MQFGRRMELLGAYRTPESMPEKISPLDRREASFEIFAGKQETRGYL